MGDIVKKQGREIKSLLTERAMLREKLKEFQDYTETKKKYEEATRLCSILQSKMKQVAEDMSKKTQETSSAKNKLSEIQQALEEAYGHIKEIENREERNIQALTDKILEITELKREILDLKAKIEADRKIRDRLRKKSEEILIYHHRNQHLLEKLEEADKKIRYYESNAKLSGN